MDILLRIGTVLLLIFVLYVFPQQKSAVTIEQKAVPTQTLQEEKISIAPLSLDKIFSNDHSWVNSLPTERKRTLIATGDILLARTVNYKILQSKNFIWPFEKTADVLKNADITFINLETPLIENCPIDNDRMIFCGDQRNTEGLLFSGVDVVNIANNHAGNYGLEGVEDTIASLNSAGLTVTGVSGPSYKTVNGMKFAFLGYNEVDIQDGIALADYEKVASETAKAKSNADVVVVQFHWGNEYTTDISDNQKSLAYLAIDSGADLIIGNHPHWIQPIEIYKEKLITYAHGNFVFDQEWSLKTKQGVVGRYTFYDNQLVDVEYLPVLIEDYGQPHFLTGDEKDTILEDMHEQSKNLSLTLSKL